VCADDAEGCRGPVRVWVRVRVRVRVRVCVCFT
jgi:hypothetical protein